jgi:hypothetical protein
VVSRVGAAASPAAAGSRTLSGPAQPATTSDRIMKRRSRRQERIMLTMFLEISRLFLDEPSKSLISDGFVISAEIKAYKS